MVDLSEIGPDDKVLLRQFNQVKKVSKSVLEKGVYRVTFSDDPSAPMKYTQDGKNLDLCGLGDFDIMEIL